MEDLPNASDESTQEVFSDGGDHGPNEEMKESSEQADFVQDMSQQNHQDDEQPAPQGGNEHPDSNNGEIMVSVDQDMPQLAGTEEIDPSSDLTSPDIVAPTAIGDELPVGSSDPVKGPIVRGPHVGIPGLQTTNLGVLLLEATYKPSASTILISRPSQSDSDLTGAQHLRTVISEAPQNQKHAETWTKAIDGAKSAADKMEVNGVVLNSPCFVSMDKDGRIIEAPLTNALLGKDPMTSRVDATAREPPAMLQLSRPSPAKGTPSAFADPQAVSITPPPTLAKEAIKEDSKSLTPHGFVLGGSINLFGLVSAQLYTCHGTSTDGLTDMVIITGGSANEPGTISVGTIVSCLKGTVVDDISLKKTHLSYYENPSPVDERWGVYLEADVAFEGSLKPLAEDIEHFFGITETTVHASSFLGLLRDWNNAMDPPYFELRISFLNLNKKFGDLLNFTSVEIGAMVQNPTRSQFADNSVTEWTWSFSGKLQLKVPGSIVPLPMTFNIEAQGKTFQLLLMTDRTWDTAFGIQGLAISDAQFSSMYSPEGGTSDISFAVAAVMECGGFELDVTGFFDGKDVWGFTAELESFDWSTLCLLYERLFDGTLEDFDHRENIEVTNLCLGFSSVGKEFTVSGSLKVHDIGPVDATMVLSQTGISVTAKAGIVKIEDVTLRETSLTLFIGRGDATGSKNMGTSSQLRLNAKVDILGKFEAAVAVSFDKEPTSKRLLWVVYGELEQGHTVGSLAPELKGNEHLDFPLKDLAFIASNADGAIRSFPNPHGYPIAKGVQVCAKLGSLEILDKALNAKASDLTLRALLSKEELDLEVILSAETMALSFAPNVKSGALKLGIDIPKEASPSLFIEADFAIAVAKQPQPLTFRLRLDVSAFQAKGTAMMTSDWVNPFDISDQLVVGQLTLVVGITYINAIYPSELGFGGHLKLGEVDGKVAIEITDDPAEGLFIVELVEPSKLDIIDLVKFIKTVSKSNAIPEPASDFLIFDEFKLDVSTGVMFAGQFYPAGILFKSTIEIFGKRLAVDCEINKSLPAVIAKGSIDPFMVGPLTLRASKGRDPSIGPTFDFEFGAQRQRISLDGEVILASIADVSVSFVAELHPDAKFTFDAELEFLEYLKFLMHAAAVGKFTDIKDLSKLDFVLTAHFEQDILKTIIAQVNTMLLAAKHAVDESAEEAQATLTKAEAAFEAAIANAQRVLDNKKLTWDKKNADEVAATEKRKAGIAAQGSDLAKKVDSAKQEFDSLIKGLEDDITRVEQHMNAAIAGAEQELQKAQAGVDSNIDGALKSLNNARMSFAQEFGSADQALDDAIRRVDDANSSLSSLNDDLNREKQAYDEAGFFARFGKATVIAGLEIERTAREATCDIAEGVLKGAKDIVDGPAYELAKRLVDGASSALNSLRAYSDGILSGLRQKCKSVRDSEESFFDKAKEKLESARNSCDQLHAWDTAKQALSDFAITESKLYGIAAQGLNALESCAEKIAYEAAVLALRIAKANTHDLDLAKHAVELVKEGEDATISAGQWMVNKAGNFIDIESIDLSGSLKALENKDAPVPLEVKFKGIMIGKEVELDLKYHPGSVKDFVKSIYRECWSQMKLL